MSAEVFTLVGGSLFEELELDSIDEEFNDYALKDVLLYEELAGCIITHIGSSSLFPEHVMATNPELEGNVNKGTCLDHVIVGLELVFGVAHQKREAPAATHKGDAT